MKRISLLALTILCTVPAAAIELSLEENRAERGSVGYVDMQRLFVNSPDAQRAKAGFEELVRQAEERVNLGKAELIRLRQQIAARRTERDALVASTASAPTTPTAPAAATPAPVAPTAVSTTTSMAAIMAKGIALPGMSASDASPAGPPAIAVSTPSADVSSTTSIVVPNSPSALVPGSTPAVAPAPIVPAAVVASFAQRLLELDGQIISLDAEIQRKEADLAREHNEADHGLLDVESRKTDQVLARLYRAINTVAHREGVSVVVDKTTILYGHPAVDITNKVLQYLKEAPLP